jgi:hypothetical protein
MAGIVPIAVLHANLPIAPVYQQFDLILLGNRWSGRDGVLLVLMR